MTGKEQFDAKEMAEAITALYQEANRGVFAEWGPNRETVLLAMPLSDEDYERVRQGTAIERAPANLTLQELERDILEYIGSWYAKPHAPGRRTLGTPTFTCLEQRYGRPSFGGTDLNLTDQHNIVLWRGLSQNLARAILNLCQRGEIHWHPTLAVYYLEEGRALPLPLVHWPITKTFDKPHWLPVDFELGPSCDAYNCPNKTQG
jgi:hypothetical protein